MEQVKIVVITPETAKRMLEKNIRNRQLSKKRILEYAHALKENQWALSNDAICFDEEGILLNGQHRLLACVASGISFRAIILENMSPDAFMFIDGGMKRTAAQALNLSNIAQSGAMATLINYIHIPKNKTLSREDMLDFYKMNETNLLKTISYAKIFNAGKDVVPCFSVLAGLYLIIDAVNPEKIMIDAFVAQLAFGENIERGNPVFAMRRAWRDKQIVEPAATSTRIKGLIATVDTWNSWVLAITVRNFLLSAKVNKVQNPIRNLWLQWVK